MGEQRQRIEGQQTIGAVADAAACPVPYSLSKSRGYSLAFASVVVALGTALLLARHNFRGVEFPLFLMANALTVWYAGFGPAIVALALSGLAFNCFFTQPFHTLYITREDLPYYIVFLLFALLLTWFSTVRRRIERTLVASRDALQKEVVVRAQQADLLNLTHDTIFVRGMDDLITYWNRGAQELYGLRADQAVGKRAHELSRTVSAMSLDEIQKELLLTGRWEGELEHTKADGSSVVVAS